ncbi:1-deoxy-D-xylulose-5-phosphate synthase [Balneicella halophila]|nr:1-deoxy-D-xylulose-5-phosphate synthase [Balneicella halophila]
MKTETYYPLLSQINSPDDLKKLKKTQLEQVCVELREFIIDIVSCNPGHFGASLGVVELTVALHYIFNTPEDNLVWDVGHQAYAHKLLTGRRDKFHTNRKYKGLSGFPKRAESPYDCFGVGHASTSISAALGMAVAAKLSNSEKQTVAVIGDGSLTGGLAFEGLNNAAMNKANILIILNDNNMAIDPVTGGLNKYLVDITSSKTYNRMKQDIWKALGVLDGVKPSPRSVIQNMENSIKSFILKEGNIFESLDIRYFGPVDGHDVKRLINVIDDIKDLPGPRLLHVVTQKGKGYEYAEKEQTIWHAPGVFDKETGVIAKNPEDKHKPPKFQDVFGHTLVELAEKNEKIVGITPAMPSGSSMNIMMKAFPDRSFDVGIAEGHAVTFSAGLATKGYMPFCNIYSTFMQRAYDNVIHDVALQNLDVVFCLDRGGLVGADGATHHGAFDLAYFRCIPNMIVAAPLNEVELRNMMYTAQLGGYGPFSIRYPRGRGILVDWKQPFTKMEIGKGRELVVGADIAILSIGAIGVEVAKAVTDLENEVSIGHYDMRFVKPLDKELLDTIFSKYERIITVEDGTVIGGFGSAVIDYAMEKGYKGEIRLLGIPDKFIEQGTQAELYHECGYDKDGIITTVREMQRSK